MELVYRSEGHKELHHYTSTTRHTRAPQPGNRLTRRSTQQLFHIIIIQCNLNQKPIVTAVSKHTPATVSWLKLYVLVVLTFPWHFSSYTNLLYGLPGSTSISTQEILPRIWALVYISKTHSKFKYDPYNDHGTLNEVNSHPIVRPGSYRASIT